MTLDQHIFISYAREDREQVAAMAGYFEEQGWKVWWDRDSLPYGHKFHTVVDQAIQDAACVLVCWSRAAIDSDWVLDEAVEAKGLGKLFPVLLEEVKPPYGFRNYHYADLNGWDGKLSHDAFKRLLAELKRQYSQIQPAEVSAIADRSKQEFQAAQKQASLFDNLIKELQSPETDPKRRLEIGNELNDMEGGDPRFGVGLGSDGFPEIDWVSIPAGEFVYGEDDEQIMRYLEAYQIARYPVTNTQYQSFIDDKGYEDERWWEGLKKPDRDKPGRPQGNRPRTDVDWYEATAFTRWLSYRLGHSISMPHQYHWERAARGEKGLVYPWGNEYLSGYANVDEKSTKHGPHYIGQTSAVGIYPHGCSPEDVQDLAGNVWEWCASPVLRGGSWDMATKDARAALRLWIIFPVDRDDNIGFRLLRSPAS